MLAALKQVSPDTEAVIMTGYGSTETAVEALRLGAFDYLTKPCKLTDIEALLLRIQEKRRLKHKTAALESRVQAAEGPPGVVGGSPAMLPVQQFIDRVGPTDGRVLITGETGTGKEVVARALYTKSKRADMPFVPVNCGALTQNLAESQLFGHKKGSFTGADRDHKGFFEVANGGTRVPRRTRRSRQEPAGEAAPLPGSGRDSAARREPADHGRRAGHLRDEQRPAADDRGGPRSAKTCCTG